MVKPMKRVLKIIYHLRYYFLSIFLWMVLMALLNILVFWRTDILLGKEKWYVIVFLIIMDVVIIFIIDGLIAYVIHKLPKHWFNPERFIFRERIWEKRFYQIIKIKKWKDKIPEIGELTCDFSKGTIQDSNDLNYLLTFLQEMGYGEVIHNLSILLGFLIIAIPPFKYALYISLPVAIINGFYNLLSSLIQRYNRPKLFKYYLRKRPKSNIEKSNT